VQLRLAVTFSWNGRLSHQAVQPRKAILSPSLRVASGVVSTVAFIAVIVWVLKRSATDWQTLYQSIDTRYLPIAVVTYTCALALAAATWHRLLAALGAAENPKRDVGIYVTTAFARRLPGSLWGPALRMFWYRRLGADWRAVGAASVLEVWAISVSGILLATLGILVFVGVGSGVAGLSTLIGLLVVGLTCVPQVNRWLVRRLLLIARPSGVAGGLARPSLREQIVWVGLELGNWLFGGLTLAAILRALTPYDLIRVPEIVSAWAIAGTAGTLITFLPGGFGLVEFLLLSLFALWFPLSTAALAAVGFRIFVTASEFVWMVVGFAVTTFVLSRK
jgi:uncharacterized membrane protein YbhN (UPF0104 family)